MEQALLIIDVQEGLDEWAYYGGKRNNPDAERQMRRLLDHWRANNRPVVHVMHDSTNPDSPLHPDKSGNRIKDIVSPLETERVFRKNVNSAFIGTPLVEFLRNENIHALVIAGLTTEHCVSSSVRMAANMGFQVTVAKDATAAFQKEYDGKIYPADMVHEIELANLSEEFARISSTDEIIGVSV